MVGPGVARIHGEMIHPAYAGLNILGVREADKFYEQFKVHPTERLTKYRELLKPKNLGDRIFCYGNMFDKHDRCVKLKAIDRILYDRKEEEDVKAGRKAVSIGGGVF